jgi:hypothetical protein
MTRATASVVVAILMATFAASADGRSTKGYIVPLHTTIVVKGSRVVCGAGKSNGLIFVDCGIPGSNGQPREGSYVALIATSGKVSVIDVTTTKIVFNRVGGTLARSVAPVTIAAGDSFEVSGVTSILCNAALAGGKTSVFCNYVDKKGLVRPGSYAFGIGDTVVTAQGWDAKRHPHVIKAWPENG